MKHNFEKNFDCTNRTTELCRICLDHNHYEAILRETTSDFKNRQKYISTLNFDQDSLEIIDIISEMPPQLRYFSKIILHCISASETPLAGTKKTTG